MKSKRLSRLSIPCCLLLSGLVVGYASGNCGQGNSNILDLKPREGWQTSGALTFGADGHISLARTGQGLAWKPIELDFDEFPVLSIRLMDSTGMLRGQWKLLIEKDNPAAPRANGGILLVAKPSISSFSLVPIKKLIGWTGTVKCRLVLSVEGPQGDWIGFDDLAGIRFSDDRPLPPKLSTPLDGSTVNRLALHFSWYQTANAAQYELQVSEAPDFLEKKSFTVRPPWIADKLPYLPTDKELLEPGKWFWRVRGIEMQGQPGEWSETESFTLRAMSPVRPVELSVSTAHPLIVLFADAAHLEDNWRSVPEELKPYVVLRVEVLPTEALQEVLERAQNKRDPRCDPGLRSARLLWEYLLSNYALGNRTDAYAFSGGQGRLHL